MILYGEYISGENKEVHVHVSICGKENKKFLTYIKIKHVDADNSKKPQRSGCTQYKGPLGDFNPNASPYFAVNSNIILE